MGWTRHDRTKAALSALREEENGLQERKRAGTLASAREGGLF